MDWLVLLEINNSTHATCESLAGRLGALTQLAQLTFDCCSNLASLPDEIRELGRLTDLTITSCDVFTMLPDSVTELTALASLSLLNCPMLLCLPANIGALRLTKLTLRSVGLEQLPLSVGRLTTLRSLRVAHCQLLSSLPMAICNLPLDDCYVFDCPYVDDWLSEMLARNQSQYGQYLQDSTRKCHSFWLRHLRGFGTGNHVLPNMRSCYHRPSVLVLVLVARRRRIRHLPDELWRMILTDFLWNNEE
jgi:hypothetical protein